MGYEEPAPNFQEAAKFQATLWLGEFRMAEKLLQKKMTLIQILFIAKCLGRCPDTSLKIYGLIATKSKNQQRMEQIFLINTLILCPIRRHSISI